MFIVWCVESDQQQDIIRLLVVFFLLLSFMAVSADQTHPMTVYKSFTCRNLMCNLMSNSGNVVSKTLTEVHVTPKHEELAC